MTRMLFIDGIPFSAKRAVKYFNTTERTIRQLIIKHGWRLTSKHFGVDEPVKVKRNRPKGIGKPVKRDSLSESQRRLAAIPSPTEYELRYCR